MILNTTSHIVFENKKSALKKIRMHKKRIRIGRDNFKPAQPAVWPAQPGPGAPPIWIRFV